MATKRFVSVSTKTGDNGESGLANGERLSKAEPIFEVLGTLDELNCWVGLVVAEFGTSHPDERQFLVGVQDVLFQIGAEIAKAPQVKLSTTTLTTLEDHSEALQKSLAEGWTTKFIYPGGTLLAAHIDVTRTVCRRMERLLVAFHQNEQLNDRLLQYINRLSDYLFVLRCQVNAAAHYQEHKFQYARKLVGEK